MWQYSRITILAFGITAFLSGVLTLLIPETATSQLQIPLDCVPPLRGNGLSAIAMGIYYTLAALQNNRAFFKLTIPMRLLTTFIFWRQGWTLPSIWEGASAFLTALTLWCGY